MKNKKLAVAALAVVFMAGCSAQSVLTVIGNWLPFGISVLEGVVAIAAPANTKIAADAAATQSAFNTLEADVTAAEQAGSGSAGAVKVIQGIEAVLPSIQTFESDVTAFGVNIPAKDQEYIQASTALVQAALQGFLSELQAQNPQPVTLNNGREFHFQSYGDNSYIAEVSYDTSDPISYVSGGEAAKANPSVKSKRPKLGTFKKQYNALAKRYGKKQLKLTMWEKLGLK